MTDKMRELSKELADRLWADTDTQSQFDDAIETAFKAGAAWQAAQAAPKLSVWYGSMPETNRKSNWTAILSRDGDITGGITIDQSEYPDRVRYEADRMRFLIGEISDEPFILDYDDKKHSGYVAPEQQSVPVVGEVVFVILFDDADVRPEVFMGEGAETAARHRHKELLLRWNCHLLTTVPTHSITAAELDRLQEGEACAEVVLEAALVKFPDSPTEFECIGKMAAEVVRRYDAELERLRRIEAVLVYVRSVLPMDTWADDCRRMIDAAIAGEKK